MLLGSPITFVSLYLRPGDHFRVSTLGPVFSLSDVGEVVGGDDLNGRHPSFVDVRERELAHFLSLPY